MISRIRELLYDEGFTVAGAKKRLEAEIVEGRFDGGLAPAPPIAEQRKAEPAPDGSRKAGAAAPARRRFRKTTGHSPTPFLREPSPGFDRKVVLRSSRRSSSCSSGAASAPDSPLDCLTPRLPRQ